MVAFYERYLQRCNEHRFAELGEFVADDVNGPSEGLQGYAEGLKAVVSGFPDYRWTSSTWSWRARRSPPG